MLEVTKSFTKTAKDIPWQSALWFGTPEGLVFKQYRTAQYGTKFTQVMNESRDGLTLTIKVTWTSRADYETMMADPVVQQSIVARTQYHSLKSISETPVTLVEVS